jgi:release factor glutamine methyltransferase
MTTIKDLVTLGTKELANSSSTPRLDAQILIKYVLKCRDTDLIKNDNRNLSLSEEKLICDLILRRKKFEPIAYLIEKKGFFGLEFFVNSNVLIPRPESELLVTEALEALSSFKECSSFKILDLGTGSGCIIIALTLALKELKISFTALAVDKSLKALEVAKKNVLIHGMEDKIEFIESNWFTALDSKIKFNLIIANPPYVDFKSKVVCKDIEYEPPTALFSPNKGLGDIIYLIDKASDFLEKKGFFICEFGSNQAREISNYLESSQNFTYRIYKDLAGLDRGFVAQLL